MTSFRKQLNRGLLFLLAGLLLLSTTVFAAGNCSLRVKVLDESDTPVPWINVEIHPVVQMQGGTASLTTPFADLGLSAQELLTAGAGQAEEVFQYVHAMGLTGTVKYTDSNGVVDFPALDEGVYLVFEHGDQAVSFEPFLLTLPLEINGTLERHVTSVPKTSSTDTRTLLTVKLWDDDQNAAGIRPSSVNVTVLRDGVPFRSVTLSAANRWQHTFYQLPNSGTYTVEEAAVTGYTPEYIPVMEGFLIINSYTGTGGGGGGGTIPQPPQPPQPQTAHVAVTKLWNDNNDAAGKRPDHITVQLISGGTVIKTAALSQATAWKYTFTGLDASKSYTVKEITVTDYAAAYSGTASTGITITNTYTGTSDPGTPPGPVIPDPEIFDIPIRVDWYDNDNAAGKRPDAVTVYLLADGSVVASEQVRPSNTVAAAKLSVSRPMAGSKLSAVRLSSSSRNTPDESWYGVFSGVPADLTYTVWQAAVEDYTTSYSGNALAGFVVKNEYTAGTTDPGVPPDPDDPDDPDVPPVDPTDPPVAPTDPPADPTTDPSAEPSVTPTPTPSAKPDDPSEPSIPQTGQEVLPVYLLMAAGVLLVLLGLIDLFRGRARK